MHRWAAWWAIFFCGGAALRLFSASLSTLVMNVSVSAVGIAFLLLLFREWLCPWRCRIALARLSRRWGGLGVLFALASGSLAALGMGLLYAQVREQSSSQILTNLQDRVGAIGYTLVTGWIDGSATTEKRGVAFPFRISAVYDNRGQVQLQRPVSVWLELFAVRSAKRSGQGIVVVKRYYPSMRSLSPGQNLAVYVRLRPPPSGPFRFALLRKGIHLVAFGSLVGTERLSERTWDLGSAQAAVSRWLVDRVDAVYGQSGGELLLAVAIGNRDQLSKTVVQAFVTLGMVHALVASGATVRMAVGPVTALLKRTIRSRWVWFAGGLAAVFAVVFFADFAPPALRAAIAYLYELTARVSNKRADAFTANSLAAVGLILWQPDSVFDPGVILTYTAVVGLAYFPGRVERLLFWRVRISFLRRTLSRGLGAELGVTPVVAMEFDQFALLSLFVNILLYPVLEVLLPVALILIAVASVSPGAATFLDVGLSPCLAEFLSGVKTVGSWPLLVRFPSFPIIYVILYYGTILLGFTVAGRYTSGVRGKYSR